MSSLSSAFNTLDTDYSTYQQGQSDRFTKQFANPYMTTLKNNPSAVLQNSAQGLRSVDPNTRRANIRDLELEKYAVSVDSSQLLMSMSAACRTSGVDKLIGSQNYSDKLRCGWIYTKGTPGDQPKVSQGELGTRQGPVGFVNAPQGKWYWNLEEAKKQILADRCGALTTCKNVGADNYESCAFSVDKGIGVPVDKKGSLLYPTDPRLYGKTLVTSSGGCPPPPAPGSRQYEIAKGRDVCIPNPDGSLNRDCLLQQINAAGCSKDGSLYFNLVNYSQPNNYAAGLEKQLAFNQYQQNAITPLMAAAIKDGKTSTQIALNNFKQLSTEASAVKETALNYAARDLCTKRGTMNDYDFCSELVDTSPSPFTLDCLQKYVGKQGGQPAGLEFPSAQTLSKWNNLPNWAAVKSTVAQYKADMISSDATTQYAALRNFLGISPQDSIMKQIPAISGVEDLWFSFGNNTFLGRRITTVSNQSNIYDNNKLYKVGDIVGYKGSTYKMVEAAGFPGYAPDRVGDRLWQLAPNTAGGQFPSISTEGQVGGTGLQSMVQYITMANLRPPSAKTIRLRTRTDDGTMWVLNKDVNVDAYRNRPLDTEDTFARNWDQPPTTWDARACWRLSANGPNYIMGYWQQTYGYSESQIYYSECNTNNFQRIPAEWMTLVQEPDAPQFSWECNKVSPNSSAVAFREFRLPSMFPLNPVGTSVVNTSVFPKLTGGLKFARGGMALSPNNFATNSWRTLTIAATIDVAPVTMYRLLQFGNLSIDIFPSSGGNTVNIVFNWSSSTLDTTSSGGISINDLSISAPILFYVNMRSDRDNVYPNRLTVSASPLSSWQNGSASLRRSDPNVRTMTTSGQIPLYNKSDNAPLLLGVSPSRNYPSGTTANFTIGWVHMFDYELDNNDVGRDANNAWNRSMGF
jgi:hypothetical protein